VEVWYDAIIMACIFHGIIVDIRWNCAEIMAQSCDGESWHNNRIMLKMVKPRKNNGTIVEIRWKNDCITMELSWKYGIVRK
jgi:hypothetical protein